ncbi:MAG: 4-(cytidine 5'-diphospho)-2-C-methyl-D-erythritol kinase [Campylobacterota bacterium]|nr:4-(cytidine 5'-diphospho)-2-C-methyl-D-erythritol kinase [Campylobacterota bacterium]
MHTINAYAKVNIFLKITGHRGGYHTLLSRFMRVDNLYDTITFIPQECESFTIEGCEDVPRDSNTIYKAYKALNAHTGDLDILEFFYHHKVAVTKRIPSQAGLGGGSSDAAAFMRLVNEICNLRLSIERLSEIGSTIGADLPFFVHNYPSANVSGFGEVVEPFKEEPLSLELYTPPVGCDTALVYKTFKTYYLPDIKLSSFIGWDTLPSRELLAKIDDSALLNDLYPAALKAYPELEKYAKSGWFFSGSGSTFFRIRSS